MAIDTITISNLALSHIGTRSDIESLDEASQEAAYCKLWIDVARKECLEAINWPFGKSRQVLALHSDAPVTGLWAFRYQFPSTCLKFREIQNLWPTSDAIPYAIELAPSGTKSILTNYEQAVGVFTVDVQDYSLFPTAFAVAFSRLLASYVAFPLTGKQQVAKDMYAAYVQMLRWAAAEALNEEIPIPPRDADWIRARSGCGDGNSWGTGSTLISSIPGNVG